MSKKTITIEVPDGLPNGWECCGYGKPIQGETMHHVDNGERSFWKETNAQDLGDCFLIARRVETAADWANKQPRLTALLQFLRDDYHSLCLYNDGEHHLSDGEVVKVYAERAPREYTTKWIKVQSGKWTNA